MHDCLYGGRADNGEQYGLRKIIIFSTTMFMLIERKLKIVLHLLYSGKGCHILHYQDSAN